MVGALVMFVLLIILYIIISDIITVFFRLTGMTAEKAKFQVISLLTNSGFTTRESEAVVNSKLRRRLALGTMLFGYAFTVTILSAMFNVFMNMGKAELSSLFVALPTFALVLAGFFILRRAKFFKKPFDRLIEKLASHVMFGKDANQVLLVEEYGKMVVAHIYLHTVPEVLQNTTLADSELGSKYQLMVMMVKSQDGEAQQAKADTILKPHDTIMVLGKRNQIWEIFENITPKAAVRSS